MKSLIWNFIGKGCSPSLFMCGGILMQKLICDMCGEEIDKYDICPKAHLEVYGEVKDQTYGTLKYDLCINCTQKVVDLIKNGKN